ncbi:MAG TPA: DUF2167 domain-containing protein [Steroidobacteraceae bacterium]|nr:DUF2167 domain-containing protein [Steroidobacteraceae bacterium]
MTAVFATSVSAQEQPSDSTKSEREAASVAAQAALQRGPQEIAFRDQAKLQLPEGYGFIPKAEATRLMRSMGNQVGDRFIGMIVPLSDAGFLVTVSYHDEGYIKDDDAKDWKADELLQGLKDGTEEGNKRREQMGIPAIQVTRWIEPPKYDASIHHLVWSAEVKLKQGDDPDPSVNYNTYLLGREGYISMNLVTASSTVDKDKQASAALLAATQFNSGKRYTDFNSSTDKIAAYGLAALVGGVALKKLGLIAVIGAFLLKFAKIIAIAVVAFGGGLMKKLRGKKDEPQTQTASTSFTPQLPASTESKDANNDKPAT